MLVLPRGFIKSNLPNEACRVPEKHSPEPVLPSNFDSVGVPRVHTITSNAGAVSGLICYEAADQGPIRFVGGHHRHGGLDGSTCHWDTGVGDACWKNLAQI